MNETLGSRIRARREARRLTQRELAQAVALDPAYISLIETGRRTPSVEKLNAIAKYLGTTMDFLTGGR